jgi:hypothetical protein
MLINPYINTDDISSFYSLDEDLERLNCKYEKVYYDPTLPRTGLSNIELPNKIEENLKTLSIIKGEEFMNSWSMVYQSAYKSFSKSFETKKELFKDVSFATIEDTFVYSLQQLFDFSPTVISAGASDDECIFIYAEVEGKKIHFDIFFEDNNPEILLNITENKELVCFYNGEIEETITMLKELLGRKDKSSVYDLSTSFITPI